jgi:O-antigen ligase
MTRRYILFATSLIVLFGSLTAVFATAMDRDFQLRGYRDATQNQALPFREARLGVNAELTQYTPSELHRQLNLMEQAHITWVRQFFYWDKIESQKGVYDWETWDTIVHAIDQHTQLRLIAVFMNSPDWARESNNPSAPPDDLTNFQHFSYDFAERYGQSIDHYQIWDEPNLTEAWGNLPPRPATYAAVLQTSYKAIHSVDPSATVIAAALAPTVEQGPQNISDWRYLSDLYALGAKDFMDAVAAKPYGFDHPPSDRRVDERILNFSRMIALREEMLRHNDGQKALWASNWGWNSLPEGWSGSPSIWGRTSETNRSQFTLEALDRADREWPWTGGMIIQYWQPDASPDDPVWGFALVDRQGNPTPLLQSLIRRELPAGATNGLYSATNPFASYSGVWTFSDLGADIGWVNDSQAAFSFVGRDLNLLLRQDDYVAYLYPTIDNQPANAAPVDAAGNAYIILTSNTREPSLDLVPVARNLDLSQHTLRLIADDLVPDEARDRWALVGYAVSSGNLKAPYDHQIAVAGLTVLIAAIAVIMTGKDVRWGKITQPALNLWQNLTEAGQLLVSAITSVALMIGMLLTWGDATPALCRRDTVQLALALFTGGIVYIQPGLLLTLISLIILFIIVYNRINLGLILTLFWAPFFLFPIELFRFAFPMSEVLILVTTSAWALRSLHTWGRVRQTSVSQYQVLREIKVSPLDLAVLSWLIIGFLSLSWAEIGPKAFTEFRVMMLEPVLFYAILRISGKDRKTQIMLVDTLLMAGLIVAIIGLWQFFRGDAFITAEGGTLRLVSVYGSPNNVGLFLGRCLPFALAYTFIKTNQMRRIAAAVTLVTLILALLLSQSAGAIFIGVPVSAAVAILLIWRRRALLPLAGLSAVGTVAFALALQSARFTRLLDFNSGTNFARIRVWQSALNIIRDYPLTGIGLDQFLYAFRGTYILPDAWQEPNLSHPHNWLFDFWVRLGIAGVIVFAWLQAGFWIQAGRVDQHYHNHSPIYRALIIGTMGSMANLLGHGLVDNSVYVHDLAYVFVLLLALPQNLINSHAIDVSE